MADGDPLTRRGGVGGGAGGGGEKRPRTFGDGTATAAAAAAAADEEHNLLLLLDGLSPSPAKKMNRSSGDLLGATGEDGKVLPELLSDHGVNAVTNTWPKPAARKQVLTFGASWDNKSDVDFLNRPGSHAGGLLPTSRLGRRPYSTGSSSYPAPNPSSSSSAFHGRNGTNMAASSDSSLPSNAARGVGGGGGVATAGQGRGATAMATTATALGARADDDDILVGMEMNMAMGASLQRGEKSGPPDADASTNTKSAIEMDADALLPVDVRDMRLAMASSPAGSVESGFWLEDEGGDGDGGDENEGFDPMEAAHAAVDRLMASSACTNTKHGRVEADADADADAGGGHGARDAKLLDKLLLDGLGMHKAGPGNAASGGDAARPSWKRKPRGSAAHPSSASALSDPTTPATGANDDADADASRKKNNSGGGRSRSSTSNGHSHSHRVKRGKVNGGGPSPAPSSASASSSFSASSTPLSTLSAHGRSGSIGGTSSSAGGTPRSVGGFSNSSPGSSTSIASMTLAPSLWKLVERGETCPFPDCAFTVAFLEEKELAKKRKAGKDAQEGALLEIESTNLGGHGNTVTGDDDDEDAHVHGGVGGGGAGGRVGGAGMVAGKGAADDDTGGHETGVKMDRTNQLDKARNHQKKHAHADALAAASPAGGRAGSSAETPSPMPMPLPSSQESSYTHTQSVAWGSQLDAPLSLSQTSARSQREGGVEVEAVTPVPSSQGRHSTVSSVLDDDGEDVVIDDDDDLSGLLDDSEDESGMESSAGKSRPRSRAAKGGRGSSPGNSGTHNLGVGLEGSGTLDGIGGGSGSGGAGAGGLNSRDGRRTWTDAESDRLREVVERSNAGDNRKNWQWVAARVCEVSGAGRKTPSQCKMRWERILNPGVKRGLWTKEEDQKLKEVAAAMDYKWSHVAKVMGGRTYKQCRERYTNYLKEGLNVGPWSKEEDRLLLSMHAKIGNKWAEIARHLKDRSENMIKNEYMKLSRDASSSHRRLKSDPDVLDGVGGAAAAEEDGKKVKKRTAKSKRKPTLPGSPLTKTDTPGNPDADPFSESAPAGDATAPAAVRPGERCSSPSSTAIDVGIGSGVGPRAAVHHQQLGLGSGLLDVQPLPFDPLVSNASASANASAAVAAAAGATALHGLNLLAPEMLPPAALTMAHGNRVDASGAAAGAGAGGVGGAGAGGPVSACVGAAYADGRVPIAAAADRAPYPTGVGAGEAGGGNGVETGGGGGVHPNPNPHSQEAADTSGGWQGGVFML
eukprot:g13519.t1